MTSPWRSGDVEARSASPFDRGRIDDPQSLAATISALERHPPVAATGRLAAAVATGPRSVSSLTPRRTTRTPSCVPRPLRASLNALDAEPDLRSRFLTMLAGVDDVALG